MFAIYTNPASFILLLLALSDQLSRSLISKEFVVFNELHSIFEIFLATRQVLLQYSFIFDKGFLTIFIRNVVFFLFVSFLPGKVAFYSNISCNIYC